MGLTSSLYSGVSGLVSMGSAMQVIGDNISNINTMGFKAARATFQDIMAQTINTARGGSQVGRGCSLADVAPIFSQGSFESTSSPTDLAIAGQGFFILSDPKIENSTYYTRAGEFHVDQYGYLVNPAGLRVQGWKMETQPDGKAEIVGSITNIQISNSSPPVATTQATIAVNLDSRVTGPVSDNTLSADWVANDGELTPDVNYEYKTTFNVYDSLGNTHELTIYFDRTKQEREWEFLITMNPDDDRSGVTGPSKGMLMRGYIKFTPQGQIDSIYDKNVSNLKIDVDGDGVNDQLATPFAIEDLDSIPASGLPIQITASSTGTTSDYLITSFDATTSTVTVKDPSTGQIWTDVPIVTSTTNIRRYTLHVFGWQADLDGNGSNDTLDTPIDIEKLYKNELPPGGLQVSFDNGQTATILSYNHDDETVDIDYNGTIYNDVPLTTGGAWEPVSYGDHNYPQLKAYFLPPSGVVDQVTKQDYSAQLIEMDFGAKANVSVTTDAAGDKEYTVNGWETEAITTTQYANRSSTLFYDQNGFGAGFLQSLHVDSEGVISGSYSNGRIISLAQVALARFPSPTDLSREGGNLWRETTASGAPVTGPPRTNGLGSIASNALEQSTVDISTEFVKLITTQRAFQADSRIITVTDQMLSELLNMKR